MALPLVPGQKLVHDSETVQISPDGTRVAYAVEDSGGARTLWVRELNAEMPRQVPGVSNVADVAWSPDGHALAFTESGDGARLRTIAFDGKPAVTVCEVDWAHGVSWGSRGTLVFAAGATGPLSQVPAKGGDPLPVTALDPTLGETGHAMPCFLPDGNHFLYVATPGSARGFNVYAGSLSAREGRKKILVSASAPVYVAPGYLLYRLEGAVVAQRFDAGKLETVGDPIAIAEAPALSETNAAPVASASGNGTLAWLGYAAPPRRIEWFDRAGISRGRPPFAPGPYVDPRLAPDGRRLVVGVAPPHEACAVDMLDLEGGIRIRLSPRGVVRLGTSAWSPRDTTIALTLGFGGPLDIWFVRPDSGSKARKIDTTTDADKEASDFSPDGDTLLVSSFGRSTALDLWLVPLAAGTKARTWRRTTDRDGNGRISPDRHWITYETDETGQIEVVVESFPVPGRRVPVSRGGGEEPLWSKGGQEILYRGPGHGVMSAPFTVLADGTPAVAPPVRLCRPEGLRAFTATADGERILGLVEDDRFAPPQIRVTFHWTGLTKR